MRGHTDNEKMEDYAQIVPNIWQKYRKISKDIEEYRKAKGPEKPIAIGELLYFLRLTFFRCLLHTLEVTGSNPVSPTDLYRCIDLPPPLIGKGGRGI